MKMNRLLMLLPLMGALSVPQQGISQHKKIVIAHRGASGYLPEHTLAAKAMAYAMGVDYIEQDIVMTSDNHLVILHDIYLDTVTDVAERFPDRARENGRYYAIDFTLAEIKSLNAHERISVKTGNAVFPNRFPVNSAARFKVPTLEEEIEMLASLNASTGNVVGLYVEIKAPAWHQKEGKDISKKVLMTLAAYGYEDETDSIFVQCFDPEELKRMRYELKTRLPLVQLIDAMGGYESDADYDAMRTPEGIAGVAKYAQGIGPKITHIASGIDENGRPILSDLMQSVRAHNLMVHPYTFRQEQLPPEIPDIETLHEILLYDIGVDGVFTDFPDKAVSVIKKREGRE